jgi:hypothetical protein
MLSRASANAMQIRLHRIGAAVLLVTVGVACARSPARAETLTADERAAVLGALNRIRANAQPAGDLPSLAWDPALETVADRWARSCTADRATGLLAHNPRRAAGYPRTVGENIAGSTGGRLSLPSLVGLVELWAREADDFNFTGNTCAGEPNTLRNKWYRCAHYTQIVWASTTRVGCARSLCPNLKFPAILVCDFSLAGNSYNARTGMIDRPYVPKARR